MDLRLFFGAGDGCPLSRARTLPTPLTLRACAYAPPPTPRRCCSATARHEVPSTTPPSSRAGRASPPAPSSFTTACWRSSPPTRATTGPASIISTSCSPASPVRRASRQCPGSGSCACSGRAGGSGRPGTPDGRGRPTGRPATASGVRASRLQSRRCHRRLPSRSIYDRAGSASPASASTCSECTRCAVGWVASRCRVSGDDAPRVQGCCAHAASAPASAASRLRPSPGCAGRRQRHEEAHDHDGARDSHAGAASSLDTAMAAPRAPARPPPLRAQATPTYICTQATPTQPGAPPGPLRSLRGRARRRPPQTARPRAKALERLLPFPQTARQACASSRQACTPSLHPFAGLPGDEATRLAVRPLRRHSQPRGRRCTWTERRGQ